MKDHTWFPPVYLAMHTNTHVHKWGCDMIIWQNRKDTLGGVWLKVGFSYKWPLVSEPLEVKPMLYSALCLWA